MVRTRSRSSMLWQTESAKPATSHFLDIDFIPLPMALKISSTGFFNTAEINVAVAGSIIVLNSIFI
ncbi:protein of unknown function (plasmid) [Cupriavidus taiwanensis]|nr:protein of unknown function [Cupriavidus taiwanensis]SPA57306.1 protein of unknown function [Cupriavidus taiwanensis]